MFEGSVSEQLHQFLTPRTTTPPIPIPIPIPNSSSSSSSLPPNFSLHSPNFNFIPFDSSNYNTTTAHHHHQIHLLHHQSSTHLFHQSTNPHQNVDQKNDDTTTTTTATTNLQVAMDLEISNNNRSILMEDHHQWSNDELLALLRLRSNIDNNCFPESTWEHVSRKLGEVGFRRTAEKCKEKFEEESRYFNHNNYNKGCRFFLTDHELNYHHQQQDQDEDHLLLIHGKNGKHDEGPTVVVLPEEAKKENEEVKFRGRDVGDGDGQEDEEEENSKNETRTRTKELEENSRSRSCKKRKRKMMMRQKEFEMLKGYCEEIVKRMMNEQEEIHSKLLHDMLKREEEKVAKEECWKKKQMERLHKELDVMAHEQAIASDRQTTIIEILNQITNSTTFSSSQSKKDLQNLLQSLDDDNNNNIIVPNSLSSSSLIQTQNSTPNKEQQQQPQPPQFGLTSSSSSLKALVPPHKNSSSFTSQSDSKNPKTPCLSTQILAPQDPNSFINNLSNPPPFSIKKLPQNPKTARDKEVDDLGKRWPRDEVLALVNVRCSLYNTTGGGGSGSDQDPNSGGADQAAAASLKAPLWERISQGMLELGYKRSAKRCKEKWENINKYFRKTKNVNKKRSLESRTCPYFHQLSTLYNNQEGGNKKHPAENNSANESENLLKSS